MIGHLIFYIFNTLCLDNFEVSLNLHNKITKALMKFKRKRKNGSKIIALIRACLFVCLSGCSMPLGMERRLIPSSSISASSFLNKWLLSWSPDLARLHQEGRANAWRPKVSVHPSYYLSTYLRVCLSQSMYVVLRESESEFSFYTACVL